MLRDPSGYFSRAGGGGCLMKWEIHYQNMLVMETTIYVTSNTAKKAVFCLLRGKEEISG
jgi:hypothetical protein